jgi:hypothetical protein
MKYTCFTAIFALLAAAGLEAQVDRLQIEAAATGGFVGLSSANVQTQPDLICAPGSACTVDQNNVKLVRTKAYSWEPALSAGIVFRWLLGTREELSKMNATAAAGAVGVGLGLHFVFVPKPGGPGVSPAPAIALHVGTAHMQAFAGMIFANSDAVMLPGGGSTAIVPNGFSTSSLTIPNGSWGPNFFAGIVIGGISVKTPPM